jgi:transcriptional regulator with XRE-family HTH domain
MQLNEELLYQLVGENVRTARERLTPKMSQARLAEKLGLTRASVANIESGRQRTPLHVLWQIAETLDTELVFLVPRQDQYIERDAPVKLDNMTMEQIEAAANGDPVAKQALTRLISRAKARSQDEQ